MLLLLMMIIKTMIIVTTFRVLINQIKTITSY